LRAVDFRGTSVVLDRLHRSLVVPTKKGGSQLSADPSFYDWKLEFCWYFRHAEHITVLESRAVSALIRHAGKHFRGSRCFVLGDNRPTDGAHAKGRSPSERLNGVLRRTGAHVLGYNLFPYFAWTHTSVMPADQYTRDAPSVPSGHE
jgi:hypothetical protein